WSHGRSDCHLFVEWSGMKRPLSVIVRLAALGLLAIAGLVVKPAAMQQGANASPQVVNGHAAVAGEVLVKFRRSLRSDERGQLDKQTDADRNDAIGGAGVRRIHSRSRDASAMLAFYRNHSDVAYAEPNYIIRADAIPNDPWFGELWGLRNVGQIILGGLGTAGAHISAPSAWDVSTGSRANVV